MFCSPSVKQIAESECHIQQPVSNVRTAAPSNACAWRDLQRGFAKALAVVLFPYIFIVNGDASRPVSFPPAWPVNSTPDLVGISLNRLFYHFFLGICDAISSAAAVPPRGNYLLSGHVGEQCTVHEVRQMQRSCAEICCILTSLNTEYFTCMARTESHQSCASWLTKTFAFGSAYSFTWEECGVLAQSPRLTRLGATQNVRDGCAAAKQSLYDDVDERLRACLVDSVGHARDRRGFRDDLETCMNQLMVWGSVLGDIALVYHVNQRLWSKLQFSRLRLPPWQIWNNVVTPLLHIAQMLYAEQAPRRLVFVEAGVFLAHTSSELLRQAGASIRVAHLVDPWDGNAVMAAAAGWRGLPANVTGGMIRNMAMNNLAEIPNVALCGIARDGHRCCHEETGPDCVAVHLHSATTVTIAQHFGFSSVDFVFVDGSHAYEDVFADLHAWWPRVRPCGVLAGHDFSSLHPEVPQAVFAFLANLSSPTEPQQRWPEVVLDADSVFWIRKPSEHFGLECAAAERSLLIS